ncbi:MAG: hypothetical protein KIT79_12475 [Deltaproteobacteria bacterium]|nr:hypothetical protein [Deltaproteobacteria bacterium]
MTILKRLGFTVTALSIGLLPACGKEELIKENESLKAQLTEKEKELFQAQFSLDKCNSDKKYLQDEIRKIQRLPKNERQMRDVDLK